MCLFMVCVCAQVHAPVHTHEHRQKSTYVEVGGKLTSAGLKTHGDKKCGGPQTPKPSNQVPAPV